MRGEGKGVLNVTPVSSPLMPQAEETWEEGTHYLEVLGKVIINSGLERKKT